MRNLLILGIILNLLACKKSNQNGFTVDVNVKGDYTGYLYLITTKKLDSSLVINGKSKFSGSVDFPTRAGLITDTISGYDRDFYLENTEIQMEITVTKKDFYDGPSDWIIIEKVKGTKTSKLRAEFEKYQAINIKKENWSDNLYSKLENLIIDNSNNRYPGDLLAEISSDSTLNKNQLKNLYQKLNRTILDPYTIKKLEQNIYPENILTIGDQIFDISGNDYKEEKLSTKDFRGKILLIDFWASWCKPCIDQFPELEIMNEKFKNKDLVILGISLDEDKSSWKKAIDKHNLSWQNIFSEEDLAGEISKKYGINSIPFNILISEKGVIIKKNVNENDLKEILIHSNESL